LKVPSRVKGLSALISDFRANQEAPLEEVDQDAWQDEEDIQVVQEHDSPGVAGRKPWAKKGAKRSKRRVISTPPLLWLLSLTSAVRPVPTLEIPASDDESPLPGSPTKRIPAISRASPEIDQIERGELSDSASDLQIENIQNVETTKKQPKAKAKSNPKKESVRPGKPKQVSANFVSLKIRSKGRKSQGRFGGRRFGR
jgi:hypothetical protein